ncbi:MAG: hypothetical protein AAFX59_00505 [Pseudomonadota bacterium]
MKLRSHLYIFALVGCVLGFTSAANAQDVVGTAVVDGARVDLLSDQTWRYSNPATDTSSTCPPINSFVSFCGAPSWISTALPTPDFAAAYRQSGRIYGGIIYEELGTSAGMTQDFMRNAMLQYAAQATGVPVDQVPVLDAATTVVNDVPAERISYSLNVGGIDVVYQNTVVVTEDHTFQFLVWTIGSSFEDAERAVAADFLSRVRLNLPK